MGRVASILSFTRVKRNTIPLSDVKVDPGGGPNITAEHFADAGDDSQPLPFDYAAVVPVPEGSREAAVGYLDPKNQQKAQPGEKRIYARDPATGAQVVEWWLKNDGSAALSNALGFITLQADGKVVINNVVIDTDGNITGPAATSVTYPSMVVDGKEVRNHTHAITGGSSAPGPTGPNNAGS